MIHFLHKVGITIFLLILSWYYLGSLCLAEIKDLPSYKGFVNDFTNTLSGNFINELETTLSEFDKKTSTQIAVTIIGTTGDYPIEDYSIELARKWGIGQKGTDNGVLLLIAKNDRTLRIEVGYGLEGVLTDLQSSWIIDNEIVPSFKEGNFEEGIKKGIDKIIVAVSKEEIIPSASEKASETNDIWNGLMSIGIFTIFWMAMVFFRRNKSFWEGGVIGAIVGAIILQNIFSIIFFAVLGLILDYIISNADMSSGGGSGSSSWGGIGGSGSSSGGGSSFGGFGGGSFGGGGSSGKW